MYGQAKVQYTCPFPCEYARGKSESGLTSSIDVDDNAHVKHETNQHPARHTYQCVREAQKTNYGTELVYVLLSHALRSPRAYLSPSGDRRACLGRAGVRQHF